MFTPEINFLKERPQEQVTAGIGPLDDSRVASGILGGFNAVIAGGVVLLVAIVGTVGLHQWFRSQLTALQAQEAEVSRELSVASEELARLREVEAELLAIQAQAEAFRAFFSQVQPWSAILQDIQRRIPADVWITNLSSSLSVPATAQEVTSPQATVITIQGESLSFEQINDFVLTLLRSPFVDSVKLVQGEKQEPNDETLLPSVNYQLDVTLKTQDFSDPEFQEALEEANATGLLEKIEILRDLEIN